MFIVRRIIVLGLPFLLLMALVWGFSGSDSDAKKVEEEQQPAAVVDTVLIAASVEKCDPEDIWLRPVVPNGQPVSTKLLIDIAVSTKGEKACTLQLRPGNIIAFVVKGEKQLWASEKCPTALIDDPVAVAPGWVTSKSVVWSCKPQLGGGRHTLKLATYGGEPGITNFILKEPIKPAPEPSPEPSPPEE